MARYIDADKLLERIRDLPTWFGDGNGIYGSMLKYHNVISSIENTPTADVVEVVRCKDCVSYIPNHRGGKCALHSDYYGEHEVEMEADDYCSCGRREW